MWSAVRWRLLSCCSSRTGFIKTFIVLPQLQGAWPKASMVSTVELLVFGGSPLTDRDHTNMWHLFNRMANCAACATFLSGSVVSNVL